MFGEKQILTIFGNISEIYEMSESFLHSLEEAVKASPGIHNALIGDCFLQHVRSRPLPIIMSALRGGSVSVRSGS